MEETEALPSNCVINVEEGFTTQDNSESDEESANVAATGCGHDGCFSMTDSLIVWPGNINGVSWILRSC